VFAGIDVEAEAVEGEATVAFDEDILKFEEGVWWDQKKRVAGAPYDANRILWRLRLNV
jgi:hypothetical protein